MADNEEQKDEVWVMEDGTKIPVSELTEAHAKSILRMILRRNRMDSEHFEEHILPKLKDHIGEIFNVVGNELADDEVNIVFSKMDQFGEITEMQFGTGEPPKTTMDDIDEMFQRHGASLSNKH